MEYLNGSNTTQHSSCINMYTCSRVLECCLLAHFYILIFECGYNNLHTCPRLLEYCLLPFLSCVLPFRYCHLLIWHAHLPITCLPFHWYFLAELQLMVSILKNQFIFCICCFWSFYISIYGLFLYVRTSTISILSNSNLGTVANNLATLSLIFARWTTADGIDSEESLLFSVSVVSGLFTQQYGLFLYGYPFIDIFSSGWWCRLWRFTHLVGICWFSSYHRPIFSFSVLKNLVFFLF